MSELDAVLAWLLYLIDVRAEQATNRLLYGTDDPSGGNGRQPWSFRQWRLRQ